MINRRIYDESIVKQKSDERLDSTNSNYDYDNEHYEQVLWEMLIENDLEEKMQLEMQEHLLKCGKCFEKYILLMESKCSEGESEFSVESKYQNMKNPLHSSLEDKVESLAGFTNKTMERIDKECKRNTLRNQRNNRWTLLAYYSSAAVITLLLMSGGMFNIIFETINNTETQVATAQSQLSQNSIFTNGWTDRLTEGTSGLINGVRQESFINKLLNKK